MRVSFGLVGFAVAAVLCVPARAEPATLLEIRYTPVKRAQIAIWIEDESGKLIATVALTEAVAYRGIGNRPGAAQLNSGYRWPFGRREGTLPIWARQRASVPDARLFPRVVYQKRPEGLIMKLGDDQSPDDYYCLGYEVARSQRDALDAVSCASVFNSDKGRYLTEAEHAKGYSEPFELPHRSPDAPAEGEQRALSLESLYPARMDATYCRGGNNCYDHEDVKRFVSDVRAVMPEIDAVTRATAPGGVPQAILFRVPEEWSRGKYALWIEANVEGDYLEGAADWNTDVYPTPTAPEGWDPYAQAFGYPYRGQPSIAYRVPIELGGAETTFATADAAGRSSWELDAPDYGKLEPLGDELAQSAGSGVDRLQRDAQGKRVVVLARQNEETASEQPASEGGQSQVPSTGEGIVLERTGNGVKGPVGPIAELTLQRHEDPLHAHAWMRLRFRATHAERPLHAYEVRVAPEPIGDEREFILHGRQAHSATESREGSAALMLPVDTPEGEWIETTIGDLSAETLYYVGVRAIDELDRHGPISVAALRTAERRFATVSACFVATAAYGTPLAHEVQSLRRLRDRQLLANPIGRALVDAYYRHGPAAARFIAPHPELRSWVRGLLTPLIAIARRLP